jgi:uncharacterized protein
LSAKASTTHPIEPAQMKACAGLGYKSDYFEQICSSPGGVGFFEVHAENYMCAGGPPHAELTHLRKDYSLSLHGVGLSIGGAAPLDRAHLARLRALNERYQPELFSEHLAWSSHGGRFLNDLLPLPYTSATLKRVASHVDELQACLKRQILLENPATYVRFAESTFEEIAFLNEIVARTGCGLLLDVNNVHVCAVNHQFDAASYIDAFPMAHVGEIHLAGFAVDADDIGAPLLIDAHCAPVAEEVWALCRRALLRRADIPLLVEWDNELPEWNLLLAQATRAEALLKECARPGRSNVVAA